MEQRAAVQRLNVVCECETGGNPDEIKRSQRARFADEGIVDEIIELHGVARKAKFDIESLKREKNLISKTVADRKKASKGKDPCTEEVAASKALDGKITEQEEMTEKAVKDLEEKLGKIGNIAHKSVLVEKDEDKSPIVRTWGTPNADIKVDGKTLGKLHHHEVMQCMGMLEMERGSRVAGHRGYYLKGMGVLLN